MEKIMDHFVGKGIVTKRIINNETGEVVKEFTDHNLIVKIGRTTLLNIIAGKASTSITKMSIGKGGADTVNNPFNPNAPVDGDTNLASKIYTANISTRTVDSSSSNPRATFVALFDCAAVNSLVNEVGLFFVDGTTMFARHTFDTVSLKASSNFSLEVSWTIEF